MGRGCEFSDETGSVNVFSVISGMVTARINSSLCEQNTKEKGVGQLSWYLDLRREREDDEACYHIICKAQMR